MKRKAIHKVIYLFFILKFAPEEKGKKYQELSDRRNIVFIADQLKAALNDYTQGDREETGIPAEVALDIMQEKYEVVKAMYQGFDYSKFFNGTPTERLSVIPAAMNHILELDDGKQRYIKTVTELEKAFALVSSLDEAIAIRDEVSFFQAIKAAMVRLPQQTAKVQKI